MKYNRPFIIVIICGLLLTIPFIAMQFTDEVNWQLNDFAVMGTLLLGVGFAIEFILQKFQKINHRIAVIAVVLFIFFLIWVELSVGIFGTQFAGN